MAITKVSNVNGGSRLAAATGSIGDRVWYDTNGNRIQDAGELGAANVKMYLQPGSYAGGAAPYVLQTTTDAQGNYRFSGLSAGNYVISMTVPNGYLATKPNATGDDKDSDFVSNGAFSTGATASQVTLAAGQSILNLDAGLVARKGTASLGDFVWDDANRNGIQDAGEKGIAGVQLTLLTPGSAATGPNAVQTATTDSTGHYKFSNLAAGTYAVGMYEYPGVGVSKANAGFDDGKDSDFGPGVPPGGMPPVSISPWTQSQWVTLSAGQSNMSVDLGIPLPAHMKPASLGKLSDLLAPSDDWLHTALPSSAPAPLAAEAHAPVADGGDALRQLLAAFNAHAALAHAA